MVEFKPGSPLQNLKKNLSPILEETAYAGIGAPSRTAEDLQLTEKDIKGFIKRQKAAAEKQKKDGALALTKTILEESYSPRFSLDYNEKLPIFPGLYKQSNTAIKDKLIAEQLNITQQKEDYKAALSNKPPPNLGLMSPRELLKSLNTSDFTPISPTGLTDGPVAPPPDKPTDIDKLPFFSLTGPSETGPSAGGILRFAGAAQFSNPLVKPVDSLGSGFGFTLKGMKGLDPESYLTKSIVANIQKNSDETGKQLLKIALEEKGVTIKDRFRTIKANVDDPATIDDMLGADEVRLLPEFDTNLPENSKIIKEALSRNTEPKFPVLRLKDLGIKEDLSELGMTETNKGAFYDTNVQTYFSKYPEGSGFQTRGVQKDLKLFRTTFSEEGVGLKAKGVSTPYSFNKTYLHPAVVGGEGAAPVYGHVRSLQLKELSPDIPHPNSGEEFGNKLTAYSSPISRLMKLPLSYRKEDFIKERNLFDPSKKVPIDASRTVYDESEAGFNNYGISDSDFIIEYPTNVDNSYNTRNSVKSLLEFKKRMQKLNALLEAIPVPSIKLQNEIRETQNFGKLLRGNIENNRMNIQEVQEYLKGQLDNPEFTTELRTIENAIAGYASTALKNSFSTDSGESIKPSMFLPGVIKTLTPPNINIHSGVGEFNQGRFKGRAGDPLSVDTITQLLFTLSKIDAQDLILSDASRTREVATDGGQTVARPKIKLNSESGEFEVVDNLSTSVDITAEAQGILLDSGAIDLIKQMRKWEDLGGTELYKLYRVADPKRYTSQNAKDFPTNLKNRMQEIENNWGDGKRIKRLGEEQFDTFKTNPYKGFSSPDSMLAYMRENINKSGTLDADEQMAQFEKGYNRDQYDESPYRDNITDIAFANLQKRPDKLVEISTLHNVKQALKDGFDKLQFNSFPTMARLAGWTSNLSEHPDLLREYVTSPLLGKASDKDNYLFKLVYEDLPLFAKQPSFLKADLRRARLQGVASSTGRFTMLKGDDSSNNVFKNLDTAVTKIMKYYDEPGNSEFRDSINPDAFYNFWNAYNTKYDLDEQMAQFIKSDIENGESKIANSIFENTRKMTTDIDSVDALVKLFSRTKSKEIEKALQPGLKIPGFNPSDADKNKANLDIANRLRIIQHFSPRIGDSVFSYYKERKQNPFYLKYGMPSEEKLSEMLAKLPKPGTESDEKPKFKNLAFSLQYGKYKIKALENIGLSPKLVRTDDDTGFTFLEVNLGETAAEKEALMKRLNKTEIDLYSQYMPLPSFEERSEEEMGGT